MYSLIDFLVCQQQLHAQQLPHAAAAAAAAAGHPPPLPLGMGGHPGMPPTSAGAALMGLPGQLPPPPSGGPGGPPHPLSLLNAAAVAGMPPGMVAQPQPQGPPLPTGPNGPPSGSNKHESHRERERERERERNAAAAAAAAAAERDDKQSKLLFASIAFVVGRTIFVSLSMHLALVIPERVGGVQREREGGKEGGVSRLSKFSAEREKTLQGVAKCQHERRTTTANNNNALLLSLLRLG